MERKSPVNNIGEDESDDVYQVPPPSRPILNDFAAFQPSPQLPDDAPPPMLMPKKGSSFRLSASFLDRQTPATSPKPAPRQSQIRKGSFDSSKRTSQDSNLDIRRVSSSRVATTLDSQNKPLGDGLASPREQVRKKVTPTVPQKPGEAKNTSFENLSQSVSSNVQPGYRPVPKPRPRTKVPPPSPLSAPSPVPVLELQNMSSSTSSLPTCMQDEVNAIPSSESLRQSQSLDIISAAREVSEEKSPKYNFSVPPDPDSLESMLNEEIDKKYGLEDSSKGGENEENDGSNNEEDLYVDTDNLDLDANDLYMNTDSVFPEPMNTSANADHSNFNESYGTTSLPKPHSATQQGSYLHMTARGSSSTQSLNNVSGNSLPLDFGDKIDVGSHLLDESSSDYSPRTDNQMEKQTAGPTTPKPFDIQPFTTFAPFNTVSNVNKDCQPVAAAGSFDLSDLDPLCAGSTKPHAATEAEAFGNFSAGGSSVPQNSDFNVDWDSAFSNPVEEAATTYEIAADKDEAAETYYSKIDKSTEVRSQKEKTLRNTSSFHYAAPAAPPPPLPREKNRIPLPKAPPVPPRPHNYVSPNHSGGSQAAAVNEPPPSDSKDIFDDLPTPQFSPDTNVDPFRDSSFDYVCNKFNSTQITEPPAPLPRTPLPATTPTSTVAAGACAAPDDDVDPERISKFVVPPPGQRLRGNDPNDDYELARAQRTPRNELSIDSDSDESPFFDGSNTEWNGPQPPSMRNPLEVIDQGQSPKKNNRYGYLYKQGGYKANKGWKRRWVVFNGTSLSYYDNATSQVSKRIVPVSCMTSVENDVKATDKNSFKFKVVTTLKNRVFIFSAETLEDCLTWSQTLMAAITEQKRIASTGDDQSEEEKPNQEGFIKFKERKYYVTITGKLLRYYHSFEDFQLGSPIHEIDMKLASVKVKDSGSNKLELWTHYGQFHLAFESDQEMQHWQIAMENAIAEGLADDTVLKKVYENMSNQNCADCGSESPHWASVNLGITVCKNCAGVHRMFDYRVSKIRSLRMDTRVWTPSLIELMVTIGNANANAFWEFELPAGGKIGPNETMEKRKEFIIKKYKQKKFANLHPLSNQGPSLGEELLEAASSDNVLECMKILFSGADILHRRDGPTAYEKAKGAGQRLIMELLYQNGGDPQSFLDNAQDENRFREDVRHQGFLNKTGPVGRTFERRWCVLEHGALTYYLNEKSQTFKGSIDRKDMLMIQIIETDRIGYQFDLSTGCNNNRTYMFSSDVKDDCGEWVRTIAKLMAPIAVMEHVGMIDIKFACHAFIKTSLADAGWYKTFIVHNWRGMNYMNRDLKFEYVDLRKTTSIKMLDSSNAHQKRGPCFIISLPTGPIYLQAELSRDTEKIYTVLREAVSRSGPTLNDQALTSENVPSIVEKCIQQIELKGMDEKGIYRTAGQNSRVQSLLDEFRANALSVCLTDYTIQDVANVLKRFLRELDDSIFERINYPSWMNIAGCSDRERRLQWYKYYLDKMPQVNFHTLKRISLHLIQVSQYSSDNLMTIENLAACFAPTLLRTVKDEANFVSDASSREISIILDLLRNADFFFEASDKEKMRKDKEEEFLKKLRRVNVMTSNQPSTDTEILPKSKILIPVHLLNGINDEVNIDVTEDKKVKDAMDFLMRSRLSGEQETFVMYEQVFNGALERPMFPDEIIHTTTSRWNDWGEWKKKDSMPGSLCVKGSRLLEMLNANHNPNHVLRAKLDYSSSKNKTFKRKLVGFRQCKLEVYKKETDVEASWNVEDLTFYIGQNPSRKSPPSRFCLTFLANEEKYSKIFGHCLCFDTEDELYRWTSAFYNTQHPNGLRI